ncbi:hypothetical protein [Actinomadura fibrosa]|uniref:Uncharacterized protein n=1 Tax=Actinomadura fibrosa TaxID=111802 RepID=A0ABW2XU26_9ACTN|nr:hypothetical protein [Actinomadura fibrosa]
MAEQIVIGSAASTAALDQRAAMLEHRSAVLEQQVAALTEAIRTLTAALRDAPADRPDNDRAIAAARRAHEILLDAELASRRAG